MEKYLCYMLVTQLFILKCLCQEPSPIVDTEYGQVQGLSIELHNGIVVNSFYGIPFAEPPLGELRFLDPQPMQEPWDGVKPAVELPPSCMQTPGGVFLLTHPTWTNFEEDCLNLNVFTPQLMEGQSYPVMVWLYGGGYQSGANIQYPGHFLAMKDVVVVVPNYRLGNIGFAYTGDENAPGNAGLKDQILALEWVQENIANFGGDPNQVTVFGQSAGAGSTGAMMMSPLTEGLFHKAILHSGSELAIWAVNLPSTNPENYVVQVATSQDCPTEDNQEMMDCLRDVAARQLVRTDFNCTEGTFCLGMAPVVDGPGGVYPDSPSNLRLNDDYNKVPEMIMHTKDDGMIYALALIGGQWNISAGFTREEFLDVLEYAVSVFVSSLPDAEREEDIFQALSWFYTPWPYIDDPELNREQVGNIVTDVAFGATADMQARDHSDDSQTHYMIFDYRSDGFYDRIIPEWLGVFHAMELPYIWGFPYLPFNDAVRNNSGIQIDVIDYNSEDREYFEFMSDLWVNFAKSSNPSPYPVSAPGGKGEIEWDTFTRDNMNYLYVGNDVITMAENYRQKQFAFWREYLRCMNFDFDVPGADTTCSNRELPPQSSFYKPTVINPLAMHDKISEVMEQLFGDLELEID